MMMALSFKTTSNHLLLCVFLSLLWDVSDSTTPTPDTMLPTSTGEPRAEITPLSTEHTTTILTTAKAPHSNAHTTLPTSTGEPREITPLSTEHTTTIPTTTKAPPPDAQGFKVVTQNETSITLEWTKVDNILNYILKYSDKEETVTASEGQIPVSHTVSGLTNATTYTFTLLTVDGDISSTGVNLTASTAPSNAGGFKVVTQNETSITLGWTKVDNILNYILKYSDKEETVTASEGQNPVRHIISGLQSGTKYTFTLLTVFDNISSTGVSLTAATAPRNAQGFKRVAQDETSITLEWTKVDNISNYILKYSDKEETVTASEGQNPVRHIISGLTNTKTYTFTLLTVFDKVNSSGVSLNASTAPRNAEVFQRVAQNETSITLQWTKVDDVPNYILKFDNKEETVTASEGQNVRHIISGLQSGTKYTFTLLTVFDNISSTGVSLNAATAPRNAQGFKRVAQNETSITLEWTKVDNISNYILKYSDKEETVTASEGQNPVRHIISGLTNTKTYTFTLLTVFDKVNSSGVSLNASTAPRNAEVFQRVAQNETSITLQWTKVDDVPNYILKFDNKEETVTASEGQNVRHIISGLQSGTKYTFTLLTVFDNISSTGVNLTAATAPRNAQGFKRVAQNETSITLEWTKVDNISNYILKYSDKEETVTASEGQNPVRHIISGLTNTKTYTFTLLTVFDKVNSGGVSLNASTAPRNAEVFQRVAQNETSITLQWTKVDDVPNYILKFDNKEETATASEGQNVTHIILALQNGTKYTFTLLTVFDNISSTGVNLTAATVPPEVSSVSVLERSTTSINLTWDNVDGNWGYMLLIDGNTISVDPAANRQPHSVKIDLKPGTEYPFSLITTFFGLSSTKYENFTVTKIDCTTVDWHVTNSSIQGMVEGKFSKATASNKMTHDSPNGANVSFTGLTPGTTYEVLLVYEKDNRGFNQCQHNLTIIPADVDATCKYSNGGYAINVVWEKLEGVWTEVEVNVTGKTHQVFPNGTEQIKISGFQPAKTYKVSVGSLRRGSGTVRRSPPYVFECYTDPTGVIAGSVLAVLLFVVLVCLAAFILLKKPDFIRKKTFIGGSKQSDKTSKAISVAKFPDHFRQLSVDDNRGFIQEYENLASVGTEQMRKAAVLPENKARNRFNNVLPYDWCRVKLSTSNPNETSDYINASYMPGYNRQREYIATQGPLPSTVCDFWRMIWEQRVKGIVMVTNCVEGGRTKCERYWPPDSNPCPHGKLLITMKSEQQEPNWTLREFSVKNTSTSEERTVKHFHFTAWPDHGVPEGTDVLIQFRELVRWHIDKEGDGAPTVVHCSAGVGRTGTIIALDVLLQQFDKKRAVGINGFVHKMRLSRPYMVQTESQYIFLHQCIMDHLKPQEKLEENIYENVDIIYANATALQEFRLQKTNA